jgi:hypothetical protein
MTYPTTKESYLFPIYGYKPLESNQRNNHMSFDKVGTLKYKQANGEWKYFATVLRGRYGDLINFDKGFTAEDFDKIPVSAYGYRTVAIHPIKQETSPFIEESVKQALNPEEDF